MTKRKLPQMDMKFLRKLQADAVHFLPTPLNVDEPNFQLMKAIVESWPKKKLQSSQQSEDATYFGFLIGVMTAQAHYMTICEERQTIKKFLKADAEAQIRLKERLERQKLQPDFTTGI
jgi:hypothetical protein